MSLRLRLALWYGGLAGLLILLVCTYSYAVHERAHYDEADAVLATSAEHVAGELLRKAGCDPSSILTTPLRGTHPASTARIGQVVGVAQLAASVRIPNTPAQDGQAAPAMIAGPCRRANG